MKNERFSILVVLVAVAIAMGIAGSSASASLTNVDDAWVREDNPTSNRDLDGQMNARTDQDGDDNDVIFLRFDLTGWTTTSGNVLNLVWQRSDSSTGKKLSLYGLKESDPDETTWSETTLTYNNAPGLIPDGNDPTYEYNNGHTDDDIHDMDTANLTLLVLDQAYGPQVLDQVYTFASAALDSFINADTNNEVTFLIFRNTDTSSNQARFQERLVGTGAYLTPEPATAVFCMLGLLGLVRRRK